MACYTTTLALRARAISRPAWGTAALQVHERPNPRMDLPEMLAGCGVLRPPHLRAIPQLMRTLCGLWNLAATAGQRK